MRKPILAAFAGLFCACSAQAMTTVYTNAIVSGVVASTQATSVIDFKNQGIDVLTEQAAFSTATPVAVTFTDGRPSTATITVVSTSAYVAQASTNSIAVTTNSALGLTAGSDSILVSTPASAWSGIAGSSFTLVTAASYTFVTGVHIATTTTTSTGTAVAIAAAINSTVENVIATVSGSSVIVTCAAGGTFCNNYVMNSTTNTFTVATAKFTGGADNAIFTLNGVPFTANKDWVPAAVSSNTAIAIKNSINVVPGVGVVASTSTSTTVLLTATNTGTIPNTYTLTASTGALTIKNPTFQGGQDPAYLNIQGQTLLQGREWFVGTSSVTASTSIVAAINSNPTLNQIVIATANVTCPGCGIVYTTSTSNGTNAYTLFSSTPAALSVSSNTYLNGSLSTINTTTSKIAATAHGLPTGLAVLYTKASGTSPGQLVAGTTYFVIDPVPTGDSVPDPNNFQLAATSTGAFAGLAVAITTQTAAGGGSFTVTPLAINGSLGFFWQASNDGLNWSDLTGTVQNGVAISSVTISSNTTTVGTRLWDFGSVNVRQYRLQINAPAQGAYSITVTGNGKRGP